MEHSPFQENVVIITGASSGIGRELAFQLSERGAYLALAARDSQRLEEVADQCRHGNAKATVIKTDVAKQSDCENLINQTVEEYGRIDTLINNAGFGMLAALEEIKDLSLLENIMQVNYFGSVYCTYYALPHLKKSKGRIVGISSLAGKTGVPMLTGYSASKHAMAGFFDSLRVEIAACGVSVSMIYPGFVETEISQRAAGPDGKPIGGDKKPRTKTMTAERCASLIIEAAAKRKRQVTMTPQGKIGLWLKLIAPGLIDGIARRAMMKSK